MSCTLVLTEAEYELLLQSLQWFSSKMAYLAFVGDDSSSYQKSFAICALRAKLLEQQRGADAPCQS